MSWLTVSRFFLNRFFSTIASHPIYFFLHFLSRYSQPFYFNLLVYPFFLNRVILTVFVCSILFFFLTGGRPSPALGLHFLLPRAVGGRGVNSPPSPLTETPSTGPQLRGRGSLEPLQYVRMAWEQICYPTISSIYRYYQAVLYRVPFYNYIIGNLGDIFTGSVLSHIDLYRSVLYLIHFGISYRSYYIRWFDILFPSVLVATGMKKKLLGEGRGAASAECIISI